MRALTTRIDLELKDAWDTRLTELGRLPRGTAAAAALRAMLELSDGDLVGEVLRERARDETRVTGVLTPRVEGELAEQWIARLDAVGRLHRGAALSAALRRLLALSDSALISAVLEERKRSL